MAAAELDPRVVVVGAGPAGTRCAQALVAAGLRPTVIDEGRRNGGQIYRRQPGNFQRRYRELYGSEAARAEDLHRSFEALLPQIDYLPDTAVWNLEQDQLYLVSGNQARVIAFDALVICSGATDRLLPVQGWNLAGSYSLGGAQVALKSQACAIGSRVVFMGSGALLYLVAAQYLSAGARVEAVLDTASLGQRLRALPRLLANPRALWKGLLLTLSLYRARVPMFYGISPEQVTGSAATGVDGIAFRDRRGKSRRLGCDAVAMGYHLRPETQLADLARCEFEFDRATRQWLPRLDSDGRSSVADIYLAGDGARVLGADAAELAGELAALALLQDRGSLQPAGRARQLRARLARLRRFAAGLNQAFPWPHAQAAQLSDETVVCRCESVTVGELRQTVTATGSCEANRAKAFSRVGMGRCQGRYCGNAAAEVIAACAAIDIAAVGRLRGQAPVKPLPVTLEEDGE